VEPRRRSDRQGSADGTVRRWNATDGSGGDVLYRGDEDIYHVAWSPDGSRIAAGAMRVVLIEPEGRGAVLKVDTNGDAVWNLHFSADGARLAACSWNGTVAIMDTRALRDR